MLGEIYELTEPEKRPENFQACWKRRIKEDALAVSQAIRVTRSMKREGKIRKSIGGTLNWHYENRHKLGFPRKERQDKLRREMEEARRRVDEARKNGSEN